MQHIMIDLETMGLHDRAPIMTIGACEFNGDVIGRSLYAKVSLESNMTYGRNPDADTIEWWMQQPDESRLEIIGGDRMSLHQALISLRDFLSWADPDYRLWANGSLQDTRWLETAYQDVDVDIPWGFRQPACYRTIRDSYPPAHIDDVGTAHNALSDAIWQAKYLQELNRHYRMGIL